MRVKLHLHCQRKKSWVSFLLRTTACSFWVKRFPATTLASWLKQPSHSKTYSLDLSSAQSSFSLPTNTSTASSKVPRPNHWSTPPLSMRFWWQFSSTHPVLKHWLDPCKTILSRLCKSIRLFSWKKRVNWSIYSSRRSWLLLSSTCSKPTHFLSWSTCPRSSTMWSKASAKLRLWSRRRSSRNSICLQTLTSRHYSKLLFRLHPSSSSSWTLGSLSYSSLRWLRLRQPLAALSMKASRWPSSSTQSAWRQKPTKNWPSTQLSTPIMRWSLKAWEHLSSTVKLRDTSKTYCCQSWKIFLLSLSRNTLKSSSLSSKSASRCHTEPISFPWRSQKKSRQRLLTASTHLLSSCQKSSWDLWFWKWPSGLWRRKVSKSLTSRKPWWCASCFREFWRHWKNSLSL